MVAASQSDPVPTLGLKRPFIIGVGNQKGGVAKTTNTVNLAAALAEKGRSVLVVDTDTNIGTTRALDIPPDDFPGTYEVMMGEEKPEDVYLADGDSDLTLPTNFYVIPGTRKLEKVHEDYVKKVEAEKKSKFAEAPSKAHLLRGPVEHIAELGMFDYVFLDTGPHPSPPTLSTYMAADWFLLAAFPERDAVEGLDDAMTDLRDAKLNGNAKLQLLGVIMSAFDRRTNLAKRMRSAVEKMFAVPDGPSLQLQPAIPSTVVVKNAREKCQTVFQYSPRHKVADAYRALAENIEARLLASVQKADAATAGQGGRVANA